MSKERMSDGHHGSDGPLGAVPVEALAAPRSGGPVRIYRSGLSRARDFEVFARARVPLGVEIHEIGAATSALIVAANREGLPVFVDNGAFAAFKRGARVDAADVFRRYAALAARLPRPDRVAWVVPDVVGDQAATLALIARHRDDILRLIASGADVLVPIQKGARSLAACHDWIVACLGTRAFRTALPSNEAAVTADEVLDFVSEARPEKIHLLGIARQARLQPLLDALSRVDPALDVSTDANALRALIGRDRPLGRRIEAELDETSRDAVHSGHVSAAIADETESVPAIHEEPGLLTEAQALRLARLLTAHHGEQAEIVHAARSAERGRTHGSRLGDLLDDRYPGRIAEFAIWTVLVDDARERLRPIVRAAEITRFELDAGASGGPVASGGAEGDRERPEPQPNERAEVRRIEDFGERLEGARKHTWAAYRDRMRASAALDLAAEPLARSWPEPDYAKLVASGADTRLVALLRAIRDEVPRKPSDPRHLRRWVADVGALRAFADALVDGSLELEAFERTIADERFARVRASVAGRAELYERAGHARSLRGLRLVEHHYTFYGGTHHAPPKAVWVVERTERTAGRGWPAKVAAADTKEDAIAHFLTVHAQPREAQPARPVEFAVYSRPGRDGYVVGHKVGGNWLDVRRFATREEARAYRRDHHEELVRLLDAMRNLPSERGATNAPRNGPDHRRGVDTTPEAFSETFGFRGVQFGNYVEADRRQADLNNAYDALLDLADVLEVPPRTLSLDGALGLAFGARGRGGRGAAAAHYEPDLVVINLTKNNGAGSLAHEWFHALDNALSRKAERRLEFATERVVAARRSYGAALGAEAAEALEGLTAAIRSSGVARRSHELDRRRRTPYWSTGREMAARAFESYVVGRLAERGAANDYLANFLPAGEWDAAVGTRDVDNASTYPYPTADEAPRLSEAFDRFVATAFAVARARRSEAVARDAEITTEPHMENRDVASGTERPGRAEHGPGGDGRAEPPRELRLPLSADAQNPQPGAGRDAYESGAPARPGPPDGGRGGSDLPRGDGGASREGHRSDGGDGTPDGHDRGALSRTRGDGVSDRTSKIEQDARERGDAFDRSTLERIAAWREHERAGRDPATLTLDDWAEFDVGINGRLVRVLFEPHHIGRVTHIEFWGARDAGFSETGYRSHYLRDGETAARNPVDAANEVLQKIVAERKRSRTRGARRSAREAVTTVPEGTEREQRVRAALYEALAAEPALEPGSVKPGAYVVAPHHGTDALLRRDGAELVLVPADATRVARVKGLIALRDVVREIIRAEAAGNDESGEHARRRLTRYHDVFVSRYGPVSSTTNVQAYRDDPDASLVLAIETYDRRVRSFVKGPIFFGPVLEDTARPTRPAPTLAESVTSGAALAGEAPEGHEIDEALLEPSRTQPVAPEPPGARRPDRAADSGASGTGTRLEPDTSPAGSDRAARSARLSARVGEALEAGHSLDNRRLTALADEAFGGTRAAGAYTVKDAYDAVEVGVNAFVEARAARWLAAPRAEALAEIRETVLGRLPRQTDGDRTAEQESYQQFSTPPTLAFVAAVALAVRPDDVVLEPSAGTGSLAIWARAAGATVLTNELSARRRELLEGLGFAVSGLDAEHLDDLLDDALRPTAILMNPPFSATAGRVDTNNTRFGFAHLRSALDRLEPGGRLVAVLPEGAAFERRRAPSLWDAVLEKGTVRANIALPGAEYAKYGTTYPNQLVIVDKVGRTPGADFAERIQNVVTARVETYEEALHVLERIPERGHSAAVRVGDDARGPGGSDRGPDAEHRRGDRPDRTRNGAGGAVSGALGGGPGGDASGRGGVDDARPQGDRPDRTGDDRARDPRDPTDGERLDAAGVRYTSDARIPRVTEEGGTFVSYVPAKIRGARAHPADLVESASMAAVEPPDPTYVPALDSSIVRDGVLSEVQFERVVYAGQRHEQVLTDGARGGFYIGDGTGVGKGRCLAAVALDNWLRGRRRALWLSVNYDLVSATERDLAVLGGKLPLHVLNDHGYEPLEIGDGVLFSSYASLIAKSKDSATRLDQIIAWLGDEPVIILDEGHRAKNALGTVMGEPTQTGQAVIDIQARVPAARVVYASATGATEVRNMAYMTRLGLWGPGTAFPGGFAEFLANIERGGVGAMEMVARDLKALGLYGSASISFKGVDYREVTHELGEAQRQIYNTAAEAWQMVLSSINDAIDATNGGRGERSRALIAFWGDHQRFFRQLTTALKVPTAIREIDRALGEDKAVVVTLIGTGEARARELVARATASGASLDDLNFAPVDVIKNLVRRAYPVVKYEEYTDPVTGATRRRPVRDEDGKPVESRAALRMRDELLAKLDDLVLPEGPLDQIVNHYGAEKVAELTGRKKRLVYNPVTKRREYVPRLAGVPAHLMNETEMQSFQSGRKRIAIISDAASTGISLHASNQEANRRRRVHITLELGWSADKQMQTFGRTHRSDQALPPEYVLLATELGGERRFSSTIARRLASLGALTRGQRDASGAGDLARYNFETEYGEAAVQEVYRALERARVPEDLAGAIGDTHEVLVDMGLVARKSGQGPESVADKDLRDVGRFLNRVLALDVDRQNGVFEMFSRAFDRTVLLARQTGLFDEGVADVKALSIRRTGAPTLVHTDETTGARTAHSVLTVREETHPVSFEKAEHHRRLEKGVAYFVQKRSGNVILAEPTGSRTDAATGREVARYRAHRPSGWEAGHLLDEKELLAKYDLVPAERAEARWREQFAADPGYRDRELHLIGGALLPIWDRMKVDSGSQLRIVRVETDDGERIVGVEIPPKEVTRVLRSVGVICGRRAPEDVFESIKAGEIVELVGGLRIQVTPFKGDEALELRGLSRFQVDEARRLGALHERRGWQDFVYVPNDPQSGPEILGRILKRYPPIAPLESAAASRDATAATEAAPVPEPVPTDTHVVADTTVSEREERARADVPGVAVKDGLEATRAADQGDALSASVAEVMDTADASTRGAGRHAVAIGDEIEVSGYAVRSVGDRERSESAERTEAPPTARSPDTNRPRSADELRPTLEALRALGDRVEQRARAIAHDQTRREMGTSEPAPEEERQHGLFGAGQQLIL